jgi:hypothetical protein
LRFIAYSHGKSSWGGDEAVEAFETTGRLGGSASRQAATQVNAVQAPKQPDVHPPGQVVGECHQRIALDDLLPRRVGPNPTLVSPRAK